MPSRIWYGIPPEILPRLFSKFATESPTGGSGLGLFISKSIVESHGGKIKGENYSYNIKRGSDLHLAYH